MYRCVRTRGYVYDISNVDGGFLPRGFFEQRSNIEFFFKTLRTLVFVAANHFPIPDSFFSSFVF